MLSNHANVIIKPTYKMVQCSSYLKMKLQSSRTTAPAL